jgi:hypothetical protein
VEAELLFITAIIIAQQKPFVNTFFEIFLRLQKEKHNVSFRARCDIIRLIFRRKTTGCAGNKARRGFALYSGFLLYTKHSVL